MYEHVHSFAEEKVIFTLPWLKYVHQYATQMPQTKDELHGYKWQTEALANSD